MESTDLPKTVPGLYACTAYLAAKGVHFLHKEGCDRTEQYLGRVHLDISGPMQVKSAGGKEYEHIAVDDYSRAMYTRHLRHKFDTPEVFKIFMAAAEKESSKEIMTDRAHDQRHHRMNNQGTHQRSACHVARLWPLQGPVGRSFQRLRCRPIVHVHCCVRQSYAI